MKYAVAILFTSFHNMPNMQSLIIREVNAITIEMLCNSLPVIIRSQQKSLPNDACFRAFWFDDDSWAEADTISPEREGSLLVAVEAAIRAELGEDLWVYKAAIRAVHRDLITEIQGIREGADMQPVGPVRQPRSDSNENGRGTTYNIRNMGGSVVIGKKAAVNIFPASDLFQIAKNLLGEMRIDHDAMESVRGEIDDIAAETQKEFPDGNRIRNLFKKIEGTMPTIARLLELAEAVRRFL